MSRKDIGLSDAAWARVRAQCHHDWADENKVKEHLRTLMVGEAAFMVTSGANHGYGKSGVDQTWLLYGQLIAIEAKWDVYERGGPTAQQTQYLADIEAHGGLSLVIDRNNFDVFAQFVQRNRAWFDMRPALFPELHYLWCAKPIVEIEL